MLQDQISFSDNMVVQQTKIKKKPNQNINKQLTACSLTNLTGTATEAVANKSTGGDVSIVLAGVELGDVTVVAGED